MADETNFGTKLDALIAQYDDQLLELIHQKLKEHNTTVLDQRINNHTSTKELLDQAHALQQEALNKGQTHVVEHHSNSAKIIYFSGNQFFIIENGKTQQINTNRNLNPVRAIGYLEIQTHEQEVLKWLYALYRTSFLLEQSTRPPFTNTDRNLIPNTHTHDLLFEGLDAFYLSTFGISIEEIAIRYVGGSTRSRRLHREIALPNGIRNDSGISGRMALDISKGELYISQNKQHVRKVNLQTTNNPFNSLFTSNELAAPIAVAFDQEERLLLVQDEATKQIFAHQVDAQVSYPTFRNGGQFIELSTHVIQSGDAFTYSCLLKHTGNRDTQWEQGLDNNLLGLYINNNQLMYQYWENGKAVKKSIPIQAPTNTWFQIAWVKQDALFIFYLNGQEISRQPAPTSIDTIGQLRNTDVKFRFSIPGYVATELRLWNQACSPQEINATRDTWLTAQPEYLAGYWRLDARNGITVYDDAQPTLTDLSGNSFHAHGVNIAWQLEDSPMKKLIPLYSYEGRTQVNNRIAIDSPAGHVYWIDRTLLNHCSLMRGSTLGHTKPILAEQLPNNMADFQIVSGQNDAYTELVLAHKERRDAMQEAMQNITQEHTSTHEALVQQHQQVQKSLQQAGELFSTLPNNRKERASTQKQHMEALNTMLADEQEAEQLAAKKRLQTLEEVRKIIAEAHLKASEIRQKASEETLAKRRNKIS